jgi:hydrogenase-4 membrane subunit HyfE
MGLKYLFNSRNLNLTNMFYPFSPNYFYVLEINVFFLQWMSSQKTIVHMNHGYLEMNNNYVNVQFIMHKQDLKVIEIFVEISTSLGPII